MQAIQVKYLSPTATKGIRLKATCVAGTLTDSRDYEFDIPQDEARVAMMLVSKLGWGELPCRYARGVQKNGDTVFIPTSGDTYHPADFSTEGGA